MLSPYAPGRLVLAFRFLLTVFLTVRRQDRLLFLRPLSPEGLKRAILDLGVCFIKMAQVLATRADFFSGEYLAELKAIHDEVEPMSEQDLDAQLERAFKGGPPFAAFDRVPLASASIGQVHEAFLADGTRVAVKIRRRGITRKVKADIRIVRFILAMFQPLFSRYTKNSLEAIISEFSAMIVREVDLSIELANLNKFRETYAELDVRFPDPYPEYSGPDALVMSFEQGVRIDDKRALAEMGLDFDPLMNSLLSFYTEQMLVRGFFHCDPHPGNLLVREDGVLVVVDFGMVKRLPTSTRVAMIELVKAANEQDFELFIAACKRLGVVAPAAPEERMQELAERMFDIFGDAGLDASSMQALAFDVLRSMKDFPFKLPQEVVYVMRASSLIEGLGTHFIPNFNGVKDILPLLRKNLHRALGAGARLFPTLKNEITGLPLTLRRIKTIITELSDSSLAIKLSPESIEALSEEARRLARPLVQGAALVAAGFFLLALDFPARTPLAVLAFVAGAVRLYLGVK